MTFDLLTYRLFRARRVIALGVLPPLAAVWLFEALPDASFPVLTLLVPTAHAVRYPNNWTETMTVSLILALCLALAAQMAPDPDAFQVAASVFCLGLLALILFFTLLTPLTLVLTAGPMRPVLSRTRRRSRLDPETLRQAITLYPGRESPRVTCGEADADGVFPVHVKIDFEAPAYRIEECDGEDDRDEAPPANFDFKAKVHASGSDHHEVFSIVEGSDDVGATRYGFHDLGRRGTLVTYEESGHSLTLGEAFGMWLTDFVADHLTDEIDRAEGRTPRAHRAFAHRQLVVDLADLLLPWMGGKRIRDRGA